MTDYPTCPDCGRQVRAILARQHNESEGREGLWCREHGLVVEGNLAMEWDIDVRFTEAIDAVLPLLVDAEPHILEWARQGVRVHIRDNEVSFTLLKSFVEHATTELDPPMEHSVPGQESTWFITEPWPFSSVHRQHVADFLERSGGVGLMGGGVSGDSAVVDYIERRRTCFGRSVAWVHPGLTDDDDYE